jgi:RimJ/RimL family protein N-acetyltransferase
MIDTGEPAEPLVIRAEGLVLREWTRQDVPAMVALLDDDDVDRWTPLPSPFDETVAQGYFERACRGRNAGTWQLAITEDGVEPEGEVLLFPTEKDGVCELGYVVGPLFRGRALATRAVRALLPLAASLGYREAKLTIAVGNEPSNRVARAAGFRRTDEPLQRCERKGYVLEMATWRRGLAGQGEPGRRQG